MEAQQTTQHRSFPLAVSHVSEFIRHEFAIKVKCLYTIHSHSNLTLTNDTKYYVHNFYCCYHHHRYCCCCCWLCYWCRFCLFYVADSSSVNLCLCVFLLVLFNSSLQLFVHIFPCKYFIFASDAKHMCIYVVCAFISLYTQEFPDGLASSNECTIILSKHLSSHT